jgi:hypothetical protein
MVAIKLTRLHCNGGESGSNVCCLDEVPQSHKEHIEVRNLVQDFGCDVSLSTGEERSGSIQGSEISVILYRTWGQKEFF